MNLAPKMAPAAFNVLGDDISVGCGQFLREINRNPKALHPNDEVEKALLFGCVELDARTQSVDNIALSVRPRLASREHPSSH